MIDVSIVLVSYNTRELTLQALTQLPDACGDLSYEVIVVDNASTDGSADAICAAHPAVTVAASDVNLGFGNAVNLAATRASGRYLLLLNPDAQPDGPCVAELVEFADKHPDRGVYGGRTLRPDGADDGRAGFGLPSLWSYASFALGLSSLLRRSRWFNPEALPGLDRGVGGEVPALSGCLLLIDAQLFAQLEGFHPRYFMYSEDIDLCLRATGLGARPTLVSAARVRHIGGASSSSASKLVMLLRGKITYLELRWPPRRARWGRALLLIGTLLRTTGTWRYGASASSAWNSAWRCRSDWLAGWPEPANLTEPTGPRANPAVAQPR